MLDAGTDGAVLGHILLLKARSNHSILCPAVNHGRKRDLEFFIDHLIG